MLCELEVNNIGTYVELITRIDAEQQYRMWFRGQSDYSWGLVPSVQRKDGMGEHYEQYITTNFMIHTMRLNPKEPLQHSDQVFLRCSFRTAKIRGASHVFQRGYRKVQSRDSSYQLHRSPADHAGAVTLRHSDKPPGTGYVRQDHVQIHRHRRSNHEEHRSQTESKVQDPQGS